MLSHAIRLRAALASLALGALGASAQAATLTLDGIHTNTNVNWTLGTGATAQNYFTGSGAFYGHYTEGNSSTNVDPLYCIDLLGEVYGYPTDVNVNRNLTFSATGWLLGRYANAAAADLSGKTASALQFAIWDMKFGSGISVTNSLDTFHVTGDSFNGGAMSMANDMLASVGNHKWYAYEYVRQSGGGQGQIGLTDRNFNITSTPGPLGGLVFLGGLLRRRRRA